MAEKSVGRRKRKLAISLGGTYSAGNFTSRRVGFDTFEEFDATDGEYEARFATVYDDLRERVEIAGAFITRNGRIPTYAELMTAVRNTRAARAEKVAAQRSKNEDTDDDYPGIPGQD